MNNIELSTVYLPLLDEVYKQASKTSILDGDEVTVKKGQNGEIKVAKLDMDGLGKFDRNSGYTEGNTTLKWETIKYDNERSQKLHIDRLDNEESLGIAVSKLSSEFLRTKVVPETDAARIAHIASTDGITVVEEEITTGDEMLKAIRTCTNQMDEDEVDTENRILFITPTGKAMVDDLETYKSKAVMSRFSSVIEIPQNRMYTKIDLKDGTEEYGYKKADDGVEINFLAVERSAVVTAMEQYIKYFGPDEDQNTDSHLFPYRNYNLYGYVYENKKVGVYCSKKKNNITKAIESFEKFEDTEVIGDNKQAKEFGDVRYENGKMVGEAKKVEGLNTLFGEGENSGYYYIFKYNGSEELYFAGNKSKQANNWVKADKSPKSNVLFLGTDEQTAKAQNLYLKIGQQSDEYQEYSFAGITVGSTPISTNKKITTKK